MKKVLLRLFIVFCLVASSLLVAPFSVSAERINGFDYDNYYELEYVESNATGQYIDTGYSMTNTRRFEIRFAFNNTNPRQQMGSESASGSPAIVGLDNTSLFVVVLGANNHTYNNTVDTNPNTFILDGANHSATINNVSYTFTSYSGYSQSFTLFNRKSNGTYNFQCYGKLYYFKIYNNNTLYRNFVPAERKSDNVVGIYDTINNEFKSSTGGVEMIGGPHVNYTQYTITTNVSPSGSGNVTGGGIYDSGDVVTLTAIPETGYTFDHWNDGSIQNPLTITATSNLTYTAYFAGSSPPMTQYTIGTNVSPSGSGTVSGGGTYSSGTIITLNAYANNGYVFSQWSDGVTNPSRQVIVNADTSYTAIFEEIPPIYYTVLTNVSPDNTGTVTGSGSYLAGSTVTLSATASNGYRFSAWSDGNSDNPRTIVVTSNFNITAYFVDESIVNNIIVGYNVDILELEYYEDSGYNWIENVTGTVTNRNGSGDYYDFNLYIHSVIDDTTIFQYNVILNNDYIGLAHVTGVNGSTVVNKYVYFNGNHFTFNIMYDSSSIVTQLTINFESIVLNDKYQGTPESNASVIDINESKDTFDTQAGTLYSYEGQFNSDLNNNLQNINVSFDIGSQLGSKFLASAQWVNQQFNTLTNNTPFGTVLSFSLVLGIALLIIGKAIK